MESTVIYRDRQELQSADLNNAQVYARASLDHVVKDAVEAAKGYRRYPRAPGKGRSLCHCHA